MRAGAVADNDDLSSHSLSASVGDQTSAGQALVVGMRRDNDKRPIFEHLTQRAERKRMRGVQDFAGRHRHRSCAPTGCASIHAAASVKRSIGTRLAKIGCKVPGYALDRIRSHESLEPD